MVSVEDLFFNVPARLKFLKSAQTEFFYCYNYFLEAALWHYDKEWVMKKNDKVSFDLKPVRELKDRITDVYKKDWGKNLHAFEAERGGMRLSGVVSDATLRFGSGENMKLYVNGRPVQDKIMRKALMDAYHRQITPGEYPFVVLMLEVDAKLVDVNVHPAKLQVKFADSKGVYESVFATISEALGGKRISDAPLRKGGEPMNQHGGFGGAKPSSSSANLPSMEQLFSNDVSDAKVNSLFGLDAFTENPSTSNFHPEIGEYQIIGQLWNSYIVMQSQDALYYVDQHALAERIAYETMKKSRSTTG